MTRRPAADPAPDLATLKIAYADAQPMLRHWLEAVPNDRLAHLVKDATRGLVRSLQLRLSAHGVSFGHWTFLRVLWEQDGLTQRELSERAGVMESTTFAALQALEKLGAITRRQRPDNRKKIYIFLTEYGTGLKQALVPLAEEVNDIAVRGIDPAHLAITRDALLLMVRNLAADEAASAADQRRVPSTRAMARNLETTRRKREGG